MYKNGCEFSKSKLPEDVLKNYVACADYIDEKEFYQLLITVEKEIGIGN